MKIYKYPLIFVAFFYELIRGFKDIFSRPYSSYRLFLIIMPLREEILKITDKFAQLERIKQAMDKVGYNNWRKYFRSKLLSKDTHAPKSRWYPIVYIPGIESEPFPSKTKFTWSADFEKNYKIILNEFLHVSQNEGITPYHVPEAAGKVVIDNWSTFFFVDQFGIKREENIKQCPKTWELLNKIPRFVDNNMTIFSVLDPHSTINEHTGWCNLFVRVHLALVNKDPSRVAINVGNEINGWKEGELLFLDDSFFHQVWNSSDHYRAVLFFDVWHPDFTDEEVIQLKSIYNDVRKLDAFKRLSALSQDIEKKSQKKIFK